jgi:VanZ family protein
VHFVSFFVLAALISASYWPVGPKAWLAVLAIYAVATEGLQAFVPSRQVELLDLLENWLGILIGILAWRTVQRGWPGLIAIDQARPGKQP